MRLFDLIDRDALESAIAAKHVKVQYHRTEPLAICWRTAEPLPGAAWLNRSEDVA